MAGYTGTIYAFDFGFGGHGCDTCPECPECPECEECPEIPVEVVAQLPPDELGSLGAIGNDIRDLALLDLTGDLAVGVDIGTVSELDALKQALQIRLTTFLAEWFLNEAIGVPYFQNVFTKNPNLVSVREIFRREILSTPGVNLILSLDLDLDARSRALSVNFEVSSDFGEFELRVSTDARGVQ